jgi:hypothetical protein
MDYAEEDDDYFDKSGSEEEDEDIAEEDAEDNEEAEQQYMPERGAFERSGGNTMVSSTSLKNVVNPIEKFRIIVDAVFRKMNETTRFLSEKNLEEILESVNRVHNIQYKNPTAYILGFIGSNGGKSITEQSIERAASINDDQSVTLPDIIRYSVFWKETVSKI